MTEGELERDLKSIVGDGVTTSEFERWFYTQDIMNLPGVVTTLLKTTPAAIVRPTTTDQVSLVLRYCHERNIPVTPRGAGSSGLFGAVPKRGGIVLDLTDLTNFIGIDVARREITAEAGLNWWQLERSLNGEGLSLRSYPSSAKSATIGGWVMTGGLGIGSLKYGPVFDHIIKAQIVHRDGKIVEYAPGNGIEGFFETEGTLGIVTKVTLAVRATPELTSHHLVYFADMKNLFEAVRFLTDVDPCPYDIEIMDDKYLTLLKAAGYAVADFAPGAGVLLVTYDGKRSSIEKGKQNLDEAVRQIHGIEQDGGELEWQHRFNMFRVRRAVPSIIPSSAYVPLNKTEEFHSGLQKLNKRIIGLLGHVVSNKFCNLMSFIATDDGKPVERVFALHTPREISNLALSVGGKPGGGVGVWNSPYMNEILGGTRLAEIKRLKGELDPKKIMNPGMRLESPWLFKPIVYQLAMDVASIVDRILPAKAGKVKAEGFAKELADCVQCGYCMSSCPTRLGCLSSTPRGRILMTRQLFLNHPHKYRELVPSYLARIFQCTLCGRCRIDCPVDIKSCPMWLGVRDYLVKNGLELESLKGLKKVVDDTHNISGRPNEQRANWVSRLKLSYDLGAKKTAETVYFVGCVGSFFPMTQPGPRAFAQILNAAGIDFAIVGGGEWCCGFPLMSAGYGESAKKCIEHNIERVKDMGAKNLVMTCPGCYRVWKHEYFEITGQKHRFNVFHSTEVIARLIEDGRLKIGKLEDRITYHDPCDLGRNGGIFDEPRYIIQQIPGLNLVELETNRERCSCCGSGGDLLASNQELSLEIAKHKVDEILKTGAKTVVTACPSCIRAIHMAKTASKLKLGVLDITELVWKAMDN